MANKRPRKRRPPVSLNPLEPEEALAGLLQVKPETEGDSVTHKYEMNQRVRVKTTNGNHSGTPPDSAKGKSGTIAQRYRATETGGGVPVSTGTPPLYFVEIDGEATDIISEDWLELES